MTTKVQPRIVTPCPACGNRTLFIGEGGHLTCSWMKCVNPDVREVLATLKANTVVLTQLKVVLESAKVEV